jgi:flavin reductase (DIM6/NTAB) family NADH-FMN oxidoreductase RutF
VNPEDPVVAPEAFRRFMGRWATGVSVVTSHLDGVDVGMTVNALLSVTLDPPTILVSLQEAADSTPIVERSGIFAAILLANDQRAISERFAKPLPVEEKFHGVAVHRGRTGAPLLDGGLGAIECRVTRVLPVGDHRLIVGQVVAVENGRDGPPLLFYRSQYPEVDLAAGLKTPSPRE